MHVETIPVLTDNYSYLLVEGSRAICIDPGEAGPVIAMLRRHALQLDGIVITHSHHDHTGGIADVLKVAPCPLAAPQDLPVGSPTTRLNDTTELILGTRRVDILFTPGHCPQHFMLHTGNVLFSGDALIAGGCGRLLGGTASELWASLQRLCAFPDDTQIYCGHNYLEDNLRFGLSILPNDDAMTEALEHALGCDRDGRPVVPTSVAVEKRFNIFLRSAEPAVAAALQLDGADPLEVFTELRLRKNRW